MRSFILLLFTAITYSAFGQTDKIVKVEFQSLSRAYFEQVTITPEHVVITRKANRNTESSTLTQTISPRTWRKLIKNLEKTPPWSELASPSQKRTYDGARHSQLAAYTATTSFSHPFDDLEPNTQLCELLSFILELRDSSIK